MLAGRLKSFSQAENSKTVFLGLQTKKFGGNKMKKEERNKNKEENVKNNVEAKVQESAGCIHI